MRFNIFLTSHFLKFSFSSPLPAIDIEAASGEGEGHVALDGERTMFPMTQEISIEEEKYICSIGCGCENTTN